MMAYPGEAISDMEKHISEILLLGIRPKINEDFPKKHRFQSQMASFWG